MSSGLIDDTAASRFLHQHPAHPNGGTTKRGWVTLSALRDGWGWVPCKVSLSLVHHDSGRILDSVRVPPVLPLLRAQRLRHAATLLLGRVPASQKRAALALSDAQ